jgi:hypothetical protein
MTQTLTDNARKVFDGISDAIEHYTQYATESERKRHIEDYATNAYDPSIHLAQDEIDAIHSELEAKLA